MNNFEVLGTPAKLKFYTHETISFKIKANKIKMFPHNQNLR